MSTSTTPLLEVAGLVKRYGGLLAIDHVDLALRPGTITGVIGPNGAGKSTLNGLIGGAIAPSEGLIKLEGREVSRQPASERARSGIGRTYQIPRPFRDMTVEENLEVAQYSTKPLVRFASAQEERHGLLARTGLTDVAGLRTRSLPLVRRKRLEVARALALKPRILLLDEVGAGLIDSEITQLVELIRSIADERSAIVIVEHVIRVVRECCSRSVVLNFGKKLIEGPTAEILANDQVAAVYLGTGGVKKGDSRDQKADGAVAKEAERAVLSPLVAPRSGAVLTTPVLQLEAVCAGYGQARVLTGIDLTVEEGQAIAVLGANGAGKTTLARAICGAIVPSSGRIVFAGENLDGRPPHRIAALGIAHCMEGRRIFPNLSVQENLLIACRSPSATETRRRLGAVFDMFPVLSERKDQSGTVLSGGQQQMLAIGRALMSRPRLVIFDEISLGLAPVVMDRLYEALKLLKQARMTLIIIEQDVDRALAIADYAYVLERGVIGLSGPPEKITANPRLRHVYVGTAD